MAWKYIIYSGWDLILLYSMLLCDRERKQTTNKATQRFHPFSLPLPWKVGPLSCPGKATFQYWFEFHGGNVELKWGKMAGGHVALRKKEGWYIRKVFQNSMYFSLLCTPWDFPLPDPDWNKIIGKRLSTLKYLCCFWMCKVRFLLLLRLIGGDSEQASTSRQEGRPRLSAC